MLNDASSRKVLKQLKFCDQKPADSACEYKTIPWAESDKLKVLQSLQKANTLAPGLIARASAFSPINLYRTSEQLTQVSRAYPAYVAGANSELVFSDKYFVEEEIRTFDASFPKSLWAVLHELAHLADLGHKISSSEEWLKLLPKVMSGQSLAFKLGKPSEDVCWSMGIPSSYASKNEREALAEYCTAIVLIKKPQIPSEIDDYIKRRLLNAHFCADQSVKYAFKGWKIMEENRKPSAQDLQTALKQFKKALKIDPNYTSAYWGKNLAEMRLGASKSNSNSK